MPGCYICTVMCEKCRPKWQVCPACGKRCFLSLKNCPQCGCELTKENRQLAIDKWIEEHEKNKEDSSLDE